MVEFDYQWHSSSMPLRILTLEMLLPIKHALNNGIQPWQPAGDWKGIRIFNFCFGPILVRGSQDVGYSSGESSFINVTPSQKKCSYNSIRSYPIPLPDGNGVRVMHKE